MLGLVQLPWVDLATIGKSGHIYFYQSRRKAPIPRTYIFNGHIFLDIFFHQSRRRAPIPSQLCPSAQQAGHDLPELKKRQTRDCVLCQYSGMHLGNEGAVSLFVEDPNNYSKTEARCLKSNMHLCNELARISE